MWIVNSLYICNILSHSNTLLNFSTGRVIVIEGVNLDTPTVSQKIDNSYRSNGSGKSTIVESIGIGLFGTTMRDIDQDDIIKSKTDSGKIEIVLSDNQDILIITREFTRGKSSKLLISKNNESINCSTLADGNHIIQELLGISKSDFFTYYCIGQSTSVSFLGATDSTKKNMIKELCKIDSLDKLKNEFEAQVSNIQNTLYRIDGLIEGKNQALQNEKERVRYFNKEEKLKEYSDSQLQLLEIFKSKNVELEEKIKNIERDFKVEELESLKITLAESNKLRVELESQLLLANNALQHTAKCPQCQYEFNINNGLGLLDYKNQSEELREKTNLLKKQINVDDIKYTELLSLKNLLNHLGVEFRNNKGKEEELSKNLELQLDNYSKKLDIEYNNLLVEIDKKEKELQEIESDRVKLLEGLQLQKDCSYHLSLKGFQYYLIKHTLQNIEDYINLFLEKLNINLRITLSGFTVLKNGEIRDKIEIIIHRDNEQFKIGRLSGGERNRLDLACILAFNLLVTNLSEGRGVDMMIFDESFENLDKEGQEELIKCLQSLGKTILFISHDFITLNGSNIEKIKIIKENKNSFLQKVD